MPIMKKVGLTTLALLGVICFENSVNAQDVNRRTVKNFSDYRAEEQARMYDWYGHGRPQLIEPAAGPTAASRLERAPRRGWWEEDIGIKRYVPPLGSARRPFFIQVEPAPPTLSSPVR